MFGWSWRAIFWANVFFGVLAFISATIVLPESSDPIRARFDVPGLFLGAADPRVADLRASSWGRPPATAPGGSTCSS